jgi:ankyrin repeat protein
LNIEQNVKHATSRKVANTFLTGLMFAAAQNDLYLANIFISHSCDLNLQDSNMRNALFYAINAQGDVYEMVSLLISSGINVNQSDREGHSPLTLAVSKGDREVTRILLNSGVNVDHQTNEGNSALHYAVSNNRPELIYLLLLRRPDLNLRNKNDQTPMDIASVLSRTEVYQILAEEYNNRESNPKISDLDSDVKEEDTTKPVNNPSSMNFKFLDKDAPVRTNTLEFISTKNPSYDLPTTYNQNLPSQNNINTQNYPTGFFNNNSINTQLINSSVNTNNSFLPFNTITNTVSPINFAPNSNMGNPNITTNITTNANPNINTNINTNINNNSNLNSNLSQNFNSNPNNLNSLLNSSTIINPSQNVMNNNLNLSQYTQLNQSTRGGMPFTHKFTKTAKLQKLKLLQERNQMAGGKQIKDKVFKFPFNQNNNLTNIEIPFSFQSGGNGNLNANSQSNRFAKGNQLHTYISKIY